MIDVTTMERLLEPGSALLSIYMAVGTSQTDLRAHEAKLRNLLEDGAVRLARAGLSAEDCAALLDPLREWASGPAFAEHRSPGLAIFARAGGPPHIQPIPSAPADGVFVGPDFHIKPLLPMLALNRRFYILMLSRGDVRLLAATPYGADEVPLLSVPSDVAAELDSRPAADVAGADAARLALLLEDPHRVGAAVRAALGEDEAPLLLVADPSVAGHFGPALGLRSMLPDALHLNAFGVPRAELLARAVERLRPELEAELETVLNQVEARLGTADKTVAIRLEEVIAAGTEGRVDAVVVADDDTIWGKYADGVVHTHGTPAPGEEDLVNLAAVAALRTGGRAYAIPRERMPRHVPAAATLRF